MSSQTVPQIEVSPGQLVERLVQYDGPPDQFLLQLLAVQCRVGNAETGGILRQTAGGQQVEVLSFYPPLEPNATAPVWLSQAVELSPKVIATKKPLTLPVRSTEEMYGTSANRFVILLPIWGRQGVRGVAAFVVPNTGPAEVEQSRKRLELTITLLSLYELRLTLQRRGTDLQRLRQAYEVLEAVNDPKKFKAAAMAMCNHVAAAWNGERVSLGLLEGRYVKAHALSHTEKFTRKMELVQLIESAMEECLDQDAEVLHPSSPEATVVSRSAKELSQQSGGTVVLALPLRRGGEPVGVLIVERAADKPFSLEEVETLRITCDLCTARLVETEQRDRWIGAKLAGWTKQGLAGIVGPRHTWAKASAIAVVGFLLFATLVEGRYKVEAPFTIEAIQRQVIAAPFGGYLLKENVRPGDVIEAEKTVLAELDASELWQQRNQAVADRVAATKRADIQNRDGKIAEAQVAQAEALQLTEKIAELDWNIDRAAIKSPISGIVMVGDLSKEHGSKVEQGKVLFEVAPRELRAELAVAEGRIADLKVGQIGELAAVADPGKYLPFEVERIDPVAEVIDQKNVFRVRVKLLETPDTLRPGMEGVAKVDVEKRSYARIWTRELINWVRMKLWI